MIAIEDLKKQILLQGLMEKEYQRLTAKLEYRHYEKEAVLFREGDSPEGIFLIKKGRVYLQRCRVREGISGRWLFSKTATISGISPPLKKEDTAPLRQP